jgi:hypothetical protein
MRHDDKGSEEHKEAFLWMSAHRSDERHACSVERFTPSSTHGAQQCWKKNE